MNITEITFEITECNSHYIFDEGDCSRYDVATIQGTTKLDNNQTVPYFAFMPMEFAIGIVNHMEAGAE